MIMIPELWPLLPVAMLKWATSQKRPEWAWVPRPDSRYRRKSREHRESQSRDKNSPWKSSRGRYWQFYESSWPHCCLLFPDGRTDSSPSRSQVDLLIVGHRFMSCHGVERGVLKAQAHAAMHIAHAWGTSSHLHPAHFWLHACTNWTKKFN